MSAALPAIGAIGAIGGLIQGQRAQNQAQQGLNIAKQQAANQNQLFGYASPQYHQLLGALQQNAGLSGPGDYLSQQILGQNATPADLARYTAANQQLQRAGQLAQDQLQFQQGRTMPFGSSLGASQNAALQGNLAIGATQLRSDIANEAQQNYQQRLQELMNALGPGLAAGANAGQLGLGVGQQAFGQQQFFGGQLGGALQNYLQYQAMQRYLNPGAGAGQSNLASQLAGGQTYQNFANAGLGNTQDLGGGYSVTLPDGYGF